MLLFFSFPLISLYNLFSSNVSFFLFFTLLCLVIRLVCYNHATVHAHAYVYVYILPLYPKTCRNSSSSLTFGSVFAYQLLNDSVFTSQTTIRPEIPFKPIEIPLPQQFCVYLIHFHSFSSYCVLRSHLQSFFLHFTLDAIHIASLH